MNDYECLGVHMEYIVTDIRELTAKRRLVYLDEKPAFALYCTELKKYHIHTEGVLSEQEYSEIIALLSKRAVMRAMALLKNKDYAEAELVHKLKGSYYPAESISYAVGYVKQYGYINDVRYAENYVAFKAGSKSRRQIEYFLREKGLDQQVIEQACEEYYDQNEDAELQQIVRQLQKKLAHVNPSELDYAQRQKLLSTFYRKGFHIEAVKKALDIVVDARYNN